MYGGIYVGKDVCRYVGVRRYVCIFVRMYVCK
jgi:hypothetical protein